MTDLDPHRRLAIAVLERCARDLSGSILLGHVERSGKATAEAREWIEEAGEMFRWWCLLAGIDPQRARRAMLNGEALSGPLTADLPGAAVLTPGGASR